MVAYVPARARRRRDARGASAVEFALLVIPLLTIVYGIICFGMMMSFRQTLSQATTEGARAAAVQLDSTKRTSSATSAINAALSAQSIDNHTPQCGDDRTTCTVTGPTTCGTGQCMTVTVQYAYRDHPAVPNIPLVSSLIPGTLTYSATVRVS